MNYSEIAFSIIGYLSFLMLVMAAIFSYKIFKFNKKEVSWLSIYLGIISLLIFQFFLFEETYLNSFFSSELKKPLSYSLFLLSSFMLVWGLWSMNKSFQRFEFFSMSAREKIKDFLSSLDQKKAKSITNKSQRGKGRKLND